MIEVVLRHKETQAELGRIEIEWVSEGADDTGNYAVTFGVERIKSVGIYKRPILNFPRRKFNVLALLHQALSTLDSDELSLDETPQRPRPEKTNILRRAR